MDFRVPAFVEVEPDKYIPVQEVVVDPKLRAAAQAILEARAGEAQKTLMQFIRFAAAHDETVRQRARPKAVDA